MTNLNINKREKIKTGKMVTDHEQKEKENDKDKDKEIDLKETDNSNDECYDYDKFVKMQEMVQSHQFHNHCMFMSTNHGIVGILISD